MFSCAGPPFTGNKAGCNFFQLLKHYKLTPRPSTGLPPSLILAFFLPDTASCSAQAMESSDVFRAILKAIQSGKPESLEFSHIDPKKSALVVESLFDPKNGLERYRFR